jgi:nucleoid-associated protein YgaU
MSPEKVAIVVVAGLIAVLLAVALMGTEPHGSPAAPGAEKARPAPKQIEEYTYEDILNARARPRPADHARPEVQPVGTIEYSIRKDDTIERIARRELGDRSYVGKILSLNKGLDPKKLKVGTKINLPVVRKDVGRPTAEAPKKGRAPERQGGRAETAAAKPRTSL